MQLQSVFRLLKCSKKIIDPTYLAIIFIPSSKLLSKLNRLVENHLTNSDRIRFFHLITLYFSVFKPSESCLTGFCNLIFKFRNIFWKVIKINVLRVIFLSPMNVFKARFSSFQKIKISVENTLIFLLGLFKFIFLFFLRNSVLLWLSDIFCFGDAV